MDIGDEGVCPDSPLPIYPYLRQHYVSSSYGDKPYAQILTLLIMHFSTNFPNHFEPMDIRIIQIWYVYYTLQLTFYQNGFKKIVRVFSPVGQFKSVGLLLQKKLLIKPVIQVNLCFHLSIL